MNKIGGVGELHYLFDSFLFVNKPPPSFSFKTVSIFISFNILKSHVLVNVEVRPCQVVFKDGFGTFSTFSINLKDLNLFTGASDTGSQEYMELLIQVAWNT